jgi:hypothetical protein
MAPYCFKAFKLSDSLLKLHVYKRFQSVFIPFLLIIFHVIYVYTFIYFPLLHSRDICVKEIIIYLLYVFSSMSYQNVYTCMFSFHCLTTMSLSA